MIVVRLVASCSKASCTTRSLAESSADVASSNSKMGILLEEVSNDNTIIRNMLSDNGQYGLYAGDPSENNTIDSNNMSSNGYHGLGTRLSRWNSVTNNTFFSNQIAGMDLIGANNDTLRFNEIQASGYSGIWLTGAYDCTIENNTIHSNGEYGISIGTSDRNTIANNTIYNNTDGLHITTAHKSMISNNNISSNSIHGIYLYNSRNNTFFGNNIEDNTVGAYLWSSYDNKIHHNFFIDNTDQSIDGGLNFWDNGYPSGGNYWSDYTGQDEFSGPNQDMPGCDNIGDIPYNIPGGSNRDRYPLNLSFCSPWIPPNEHPEVNITSPTQGETISGMYTIAGIASDPEDGLQFVEVRIDDGPWIKAIEESLWTFEWNTTNVSNGEHTIYARSYDGDNYSTEVNVTVIVDNPSPPTDQEPKDDWLWVALAVIIVIVVIVLLIVFLLIRRRKKSLEVEESPEPPPEEPL